MTDLDYRLECLKIAERLAESDHITAGEIVTKAGEMWAFIEYKPSKSSKNKQTRSDR